MLKTLSEQGIYLLAAHDGCNRREYWWTANRVTDNDRVSNAAWPHKSWGQEDISGMLMDRRIHYRISLYSHFLHVLQNAEKCPAADITRPLSEAVLHISTIRCSAVTNGNKTVCIVFMIQKRDEEELSVRVQSHSNTFSRSKTCIYSEEGETFVFKETLTTDRLKKELIKQSEDILTICCLSAVKLDKNWILRFP